MDREGEKMSITKNEVEQVAMVARLALSEEEKDYFTKDLNSILQFIEQLNQLDTNEVDMTIHAIPISNVFREDVIGETLEVDKALQNAPDEKDGQYRVPRIL